MKYRYNDCLQYIPQLNLYTKRRIRTDYWKDVVQDTLLYLYLNFDTIEITNLKGLIFNTANFFIQKHYTKQTNNKVIGYDNIETALCLKHIKMNASIKIGKYNSCMIDDSLFNSLNKISKSLFIPFQMQLNGYSIDEIGKKLKTNENTIKTRIRRCKSALKDNIEL